MVSSVIFVLIGFSSCQNGGTSCELSNKVLSLTSTGLRDISEKRLKRLGMVVEKER